MKELTDEQIEAARKAVVAKHGHESRYGIVLTIDLLRTVAPFLQLPWEEPTEKEVFELSDSLHKRAAKHGVLASDTDIVFEFVRARNDKLLPKPVGPLREGILRAIRGIPNIRFTSDAEEMLADSILAEIAKPLHFGFTGFKP